KAPALSDKPQTVKRLLPIALLLAGCQQAMQIPEPTLQQPQINTELLVQAPPSRTQPTLQPHPYQYLAPQPIRNPWLPYVQSPPGLTAGLMAPYRLPASHIIGHSDCKHTNCPGRYMDLAQLRTMATRAAVSPTIARIE